MKKIFVAATILVLLGMNNVSDKLLSVVNLKTQLHINGEAAVVLNADNGELIYEKNADQALSPSSMTKMMSSYLILEAIKDQQLDWNDLVPISSYAEMISQDLSLSNVPLKKGNPYTVRELFEAMLIYSANGATIALAEKLTGTEEEFINHMNKKANELELETYKFINCTGLNNRDLKGMHPKGTDKDDENVMSAKSTGLLALHLVKDYPEILEVTQIPRLIFQAGTNHSIEMENWNWMLTGQKYEYPGMDGLKTGSTEDGGYSFASTAVKNGERLITVVMKTSSRDERFIETRKLLDYGFNVLN
ncbi:serine hydrolase [Bacillus sp. 31A1R]|uniref:Serine hydrolase n=1 Tax=Robertmurraya mangrovi TaxID=3098077 RepID=A0ABU5ITJ6_9BACI|nr:serine hydrolase [Bacillus sp. 31A1R]MDZ5470469.1 serine hydrolase [Bacillus sp. 31A1R]